MSEQVFLIAQLTIYDLWPRNVGPANVEWSSEH